MQGDGEAGDSRALSERSSVLSLMRRGIREDDGKSAFNLALWCQNLTTLSDSVPNPISTL